MRRKSKKRPVLNPVPKSKKFSFMVICLSGAWEDVHCASFREMIERGRNVAIEDYVRSVRLSREMRNGLRTVIGYISGHNGRVWISKDPLNGLWWRGEIPKEENRKVQEITNKYKTEILDYVI